jgi:cell division ATPase FtsA
LAAIEKAPSRTLKLASDSFSTAAAQMQQDATQFGEASRAVLKGIIDELAGTAQAVRVHNAALEADLGVSRSNVSKVHTALVEMTDSLASQVEARRTS